MESKKGFGKRLEQIIEGRGFYIVMALCAAIIGVSIWTLLKSPSPAIDEAEFDEVLSEVEPMPFDPAEPELREAQQEEEASAETAEPTDEPAMQTAAESAVVWPLEGEIIRDYSMDALQYDPTMSDWRTHDGVDIAAQPGDKVAAIRAGTVRNVFVDDAFGTTVEIDHGNGLVIAYCNLESVPTVYTGDAVQAGDVIGSVGQTAIAETAQECHLHLRAELNGKSTSPLDYLPQKN